MSDCCNDPLTTAAQSHQHCPGNGAKGKPVPLITLKSLLVPGALAQLNAQQSYRFCASSDCPVVYFGANGQTFEADRLKVPVFAKDLSPEVPVCYCFDWRRHQLRDPANRHALDDIAAHIQAKRCGCEANNPQGRCCLADVRSTMAVSSEMDSG